MFTREELTQVQREISKGTEEAFLKGAMTTEVRDLIFQMMEREVEYWKIIHHFKKEGIIK